jgi:hypothetical protein
VLVGSWGAAYGDISGSATTASPDHSYLALMELISGSPNISLLYFLFFFIWMTPKYRN